jgi:hypothetical protein
VGAIDRLARVLVALLALVVVFAPRPVEGHADVGTLSATVLSPGIDVSSPPAAVKTIADVAPLALLAAGLAVVVTTTARRRRTTEPALRFRPAAPRRRPPRRGPPVLLV